MGWFRFGRKQQATTPDTVTLHKHTSEDSCYTHLLPCGFTIGELILLHWINKHGTATELPKSFHDILAVQPSKALYRFRRDGYLTQEKTSASLNALNIETLQQLLSQHHLPHDGRKLELIARIMEQLDWQQLDIPEIMSLTDLGHQLLTTYRVYIRAYQDRFFDVPQLLAAQQKFPHLTQYNELKDAWLRATYSQQSLQKAGVAVQQTCYAQADLAMQQKQYALALSYWVEAVLREANNTPPQVSEQTMAKLHRAISMGQLTESLIQRSCNTGKQRFCTLLPHHQLTGAVLNTLVAQAPYWQHPQVVAFLRGEVPDTNITLLPITSSNTDEL